MMVVVVQNLKSVIVEILKLLVRDYVKKVLKLVLEENFLKMIV